MSDYAFYGGGGFGGINKPNVIKTVIVPVSTASTSVPKADPTDPPVYKEVKKRRQTKPRKKSKDKAKPKKMKAPKKRKQPIISRNIHFGKNF